MCRHKKTNPISIHAPARGATGDLQLQINDIDISIHAPARGATIDIGGIQMFYVYFNPRSREGSDVPSPGTHWLWNVFQSTLPRGERRFSDNLLSNLTDISIHAPARGATISSITCRVNISISIHAPARGATRVWAST